MKTQLLKACPESLEKGAEIIRAGGLVAFPTETVYGLGADAMNGEAVNSIFRAKGRPNDNPLIVHVCSKEQMKELGYWNDNAEAVYEAFMPGPITMVLKKKQLPPEVTAGLDTVGLRFPVHPDAQKFLALAGPVAAPSANLSGKPSPTCAQHVFADFDGKIPLIIDGGECGVGVESTVISLAERPVLLRPGGITPEQLKAVLPDMYIHEAVLKNITLDAVASPGMKYKHYAPEARVVLTRSDGKALLADALAHGVRAELFGGERAEVQAHELFARLRQADAMGLELVIFSAPSCDGVGLSVMNRLLRASAFTVLSPGEEITVNYSGGSARLHA